MQLDFTKMQSLGNDFVVLDGVSRALNITSGIARLLADRHFGVGCDQILLAEAAGQCDNSDFRFRIFNQDGSEVGQCGNGARCFARFLRDKSLSDKDLIPVQTLTSQMLLQLLENGDVRVDMGVPRFAPDQIPLLAGAEAQLYPVHFDIEVLEVAALSLGNPHSVLVVEDVDSYPVVELGARIESHSMFPERVNAGFMQIVDRGHIKLRVFERGVGETLGCGSGACAAVVAGIRMGQLDSRVTVSLPGGDAEVEWQGDDQSVYLTGPAHTVFCGKIEVP